jgi:hypothetical protein
METVREALDRHILSMQSGGCIPNYEENDFNAGVMYGFEQGFVAGVEFAQRWISVDEELPEPDKALLIKKYDYLTEGYNVCRGRIVYADNGEFSHLEFISIETGKIIEDVEFWRHIKLK